MNKFLTAFLFTSYCLVASADVDRDLRGQPKQNKLVVHMCKYLSGDCSVLSDINYQDITRVLGESSASPAFGSLETIEVHHSKDQKSSNPGPKVWVTCDGEDGDCLQWSLNATNWPVQSNYSITQKQQRDIYNKLIENTEKQNTHLYFYRHEARISQSGDQGKFTYYDLRNARLVIK